MLSAIDELLRAALAAVFPAGSEVTAGPSLPPLSAAMPRVSVCATALIRCSPEKAEDSAEARDPAYSTQRFTLNPTRSKPREVTLPDSAAGQVAEVQLSSGRLLRAGDGYTVEGRTVRFYDAPAGAIAVQTRGAAVRGYREISPCQVDVELNAWAGDAAAADGLLTRALIAALARLAELDVIELASVEEGSSIRVLKPVARLDFLGRAGETVAGAAWTCSTARLALRGELEMMLALGAPEPAGVIERIDGAIVYGAPGTESFTLEKGKG